MLTLSELREIMPRAGGSAATFLEPLNASCDEFDIDNPDRLAAFLANVAVESRELTRVSEDMNYSVARLLVVWPTRFHSAVDAQPYAMQPQKLANLVYANRMSNGDTASGDGWRYRGAGLIQLTGKENQTACARFFGITTDIGDWLRTPEGAARSAGWYWRSHGCNKLADAGAFTQCVRAINPAKEGLDQRMKFWVTAKFVLG